MADAGKAAERDDSGSIFPARRMRKRKEKKNGEAWRKANRAVNNEAEAK